MMTYRDKGLGSNIDPIRTFSRDLVWREKSNLRRSIGMKTKSTWFVSSWCRAVTGHMMKTPFTMTKYGHQMAGAT
jgi:hypothetical protein